MKIFTYVKSKQKNRVKKKIENEQKEGNIDERRAKIYIIHNACVCLCQRQNVFSLLEGKLVTNGKLEHAVLVVLILEGFGQTKVVATLNNEVAELIAQADRHRQLKGVLVNAICLYRAATRLSLSLVVNAESGLQAELNGETRSYINVSENGNVDVVELVSIIYFVFSSCASLHRIESAEAYT